MAEVADVRFTQRMAPEALLDAEPAAAQLGNRHSRTVRDRIGADGAGAFGSARDRIYAERDFKMAANIMREIG